MVKTSYTDHHSHIVLWLPIMKGQKSLTLCWRSFSWWAGQLVTTLFAYNGSQYLHYEKQQPSHNLLPKFHDQKSLTLCWCSFSNHAGRVSLSHLHIKAANTSFMYGRTQSPLRLPMIQDEIFLMLHLCSFPLVHICNMLSYNLALYIIKGVLAAVL